MNNNRTIIVISAIVLTAVVCGIVFSDEHASSEPISEKNYEGYWHCVGGYTMNTNGYNLLDISENPEYLKQAFNITYVEGGMVFGYGPEGEFTGTIVNGDIKAEMISETYRASCIAKLLDESHIVLEYLSYMSDGNTGVGHIYLAKNMCDFKFPSIKMPSISNNWICVDAQAYCGDETKEIVKPSLTIIQQYINIFKGMISMEINGVKITQSLSGFLNMENGEIYGRIINGSGILSTIRYYENTIYITLCSTYGAFSGKIDVMRFAFTEDGDERDVPHNYMDVVGIKWTAAEYSECYSDGTVKKIDRQIFFTIDGQYENIVYGTIFKNNSIMNFTGSIVKTNGGYVLHSCDDNGDLLSCTVQDNVSYMTVKRDGYVEKITYQKIIDVDKNDLAGHWYAMTVIGYTNYEKTVITRGNENNHLADLDIFGIYGTMMFGKIFDFNITGTVHEGIIQSNFEYEGYSIMIYGSKYSADAMTLNVVATSEDSKICHSIYYSRDKTDAEVPSGFESYLGTWKPVECYIFDGIRHEIENATLDMEELNGMAIKGSYSYNGTETKFMATLFTIYEKGTLEAIGISDNGDTIHFTEIDGIMTLTINIDDNDCTGSAYMKFINASIYSYNPKYVDVTGMWKSTALEVIDSYGNIHNEDDEKILTVTEQYGNTAIGTYKTETTEGTVSIILVYQENTYTMEMLFKSDSKIEYRAYGWITENGIISIIKSDIVNGIHQTEKITVQSTGT